MSTLDTVILTRESVDNADLKVQLSAAGLKVIDYPCIRTQFFPFEINALENQSMDDFDVVVFTSKRSVIAIKNVADNILMSSAIIASVGQTTSDFIRRIIGKEPEIEPTTQTGEALAEEICSAMEDRIASVSDNEDKKFRVLYFRGDKSNPRFREIIENGGGRLTQYEVYATERPELEPLYINKTVVGVFASPSAANHFIEINSHIIDRLLAVAIGPVTAWRLRELGVANIVEAPEPSVTALFNVIVKQCRQTGENI